MRPTTQDITNNIHRKIYSIYAEMNYRIKLFMDSIAIFLNLNYGILIYFFIPEVSMTLFFVEVVT